MDENALVKDLKIICGNSDGSTGEPLVSVLMRLDRAANDSALPPKLRHYLKQRSYMKALAALDDSGTAQQVMG